MSRPDSTPLLPTIHVPTLILVGDEDTVTPPPLSEKMHHAHRGVGADRHPRRRPPERISSSRISSMRRSRDSSTIGYSPPMRVLRSLLLICASTLLVVPATHAQESPAESARRKNFDQLLDLYVRNGDVYYRALKSDRAKLDGFVTSQAAAAVDKLSRRGADGVLAERLQRARAQNGDRSLPDCRPVGRVSGEEHPADSRRLRTPAASRRGTHGDARSRSSRQSSPASTIRASSSPSAAAPPAAADCAAKRSTRRASRSSSPKRLPSVRPARSASPSIARAGSCTPARFSRGARRNSPPLTPTRRRRRSRTAARSSARLSPTSCRSCCRARRNTWRRTASRWPTTRSTGR